MQIKFVHHCVHLIKFGMVNTVFARKELQDMANVFNAQLDLKPIILVQVASVLILIKYSH
jgi:hypothetical protein